LELLAAGKDLLAVPFAFEARGRCHSIRPKQAIEEIGELYAIVSKSRPRFVCEIGVYRGGTFYLWCQAAAPDAVLLGLDLPSEYNGTGFYPARIAFFQHFPRAHRQRLHFIGGDSQLRSTVNRVESVLRENRLDFLFIDGDHSYNGVRQDWELYGPLVRSGGMVAFHDILPRLDAPAAGVHRLWDEIKRGYRHREIIASDGPDAHRMGIGVLWI
jgi:predicted O-methyltransferase YrrM